MSEAHDHKKFEFFVDAKRYQADQESLTGAQIKATASVQADYQLFLEEEGDKPDRPISDNDAIPLSGKVKHFFAVPPATFGL
jgi:Multiubiquitin